MTTNDARTARSTSNRPSPTPNLHHHNRTDQASIRPGRPDQRIRTSRLKDQVNAGGHNPGRPPVTTRGSLPGTAKLFDLIQGNGHRYRRQEQIRLAEAARVRAGCPVTTAARMSPSKPSSLGLIHLRVELRRCANQTRLEVFR
jgi:hypothetical protein